MMIADIIQARMGSTRLPGKVLADICGKPALAHVIERVKRGQLLNKVLVATTTQQRDDVVVKVAQDCGVECYRGNEEDVLDRYYRAAVAIGADVIVRTTADCPLLDPQVIDKVINYYQSRHDSLDYVGTSLKPTYPDGVDTEVFPIKVLERAWKEAKKPSEREHVTPYIRNHPELFRLANVENEENISHLRWTLDTEADLRFIREVYTRLYEEGKIFLIEDILNLLQKRPELIKINAGYIRDERYWRQVATET